LNKKNGAIMRWQLIFILFIFVIFNSSKFLVKGDRKWKDVKIFKEMEYGLIFPALVRVSYDGKYVYVLDYGDLKIKKFSSDGRFLSEYGKGKGEGPGEFKNPTDFVIDKNYNVWVCDPSNGLVTIFRDNGDILKTIRLKSVPLRLEIVDEKWLAIRPVTTGENLIEVYDLDGNFKFGFGKELTNVQRDVLFGGWMDSEGEFLYFGFERLSYILSFDLKGGKISYVKRTVDEFPDPMIETFSVNGHTVRGLPKDAPFSVMSLNVKNGLIFVKSGANWRKREDLTIIDVYSASNGEYRYSFKIPKRISVAYFDGDFIYGISDTTLIKWRIKF
jgi:hypothetical protein